MFKIYDGRKEFYQWDLNRKLIVEDKSINEVHFSNRTTDYSLITEVYELDGLRVADVPNILLQESWDIKVYAYDSEYTKHCETYNVIARTRPDDYVYTETEQRKWEHLEARIDEIEQNGIPEEAIENAVDKYLDENGVEIDMTGIATEEYVQEQIANIEHPTIDLTGYATEKYVNDAIATINIPEVEEVDLSNYYTKTETDSAINAAKPDLSGYALKTEIPDVSNLATKDEIPSTAGLATEEYVDNAVANIEIPEVIKHISITDINQLLNLETGFYYIDDGFWYEESIYFGILVANKENNTFTFIDTMSQFEYSGEEWYCYLYVLYDEYSAVSERLDNIESAGFQTEEQVNALITTALGNIGVAEEASY